MNTFDPERRKAEEHAVKEARMQYVEELASAKRTLMAMPGFRLRMRREMWHC